MRKNKTVAEINFEDRNNHISIETETWETEIDNQLFRIYSFNPKKSININFEYTYKYFQNAKTPVVIIDKENIITEVNKSFQKVFLVKKNENLDRFINKEANSYFYEWLKNIHENKKVSNYFRLQLETSKNDIIGYEIKAHITDENHDNLILSFFDISSNIKLRSFKNLLKKGLDATDTPMAIFIENGEILFANKFFKNILKNQKIAARSAWDIIKENFDATKNSICSDILRNEIFLSEFTLQNKSNSLISYKINIIKELLDQDYFIISLKKHMSGVKVNSAALDIHKTVYDAIDDIVFILDNFFIIKSLNAKGIKYFDVKVDRIHELNFTNFVAIQDKALLLENLVHVLDGHNISFDIRLNDKVEGYRWFSVKCSGIVENDEITEIVGIARDITKEVEISKKLQLHTENLESLIKLRTFELVRSRKQYQSLINSAEDMIFLVNKDFKVQMLNDAGCIFVGKPLKFIKDKHITDVFSDDLSEKLKDILFNSLYSKKGYMGEHEVRFSNEKMILQTKVSPIKGKNGNVIEFVGISRDITYQRKLQQKLDIERETTIQSSKLAAIGEMATGIAHEINQPLNHLNFTFSMNDIELNKEKPDFKKIKRANNLCLQDIHRATDIIQHLRNFGRKETKDIYEPVDVNEIIEKTKYLFTEQLKKLNINFEEDIHATESTFLGGRNRFEQVIINLINNARDALNKTENPKIIYRTYNKNNKLFVEIEDNGPGITEKNLDLIFTPFYTTKDVGKGTGIGLSISYGIITSFNGMMYVNSKPKKTIFIIELPISEDIIL
jgi:PAS domain S-box-containing protein